MAVTSESATVLQAPTQNLLFTKMHERVSRGYLSDLVNEYKDAKVKGEVALIKEDELDSFYLTHSYGPSFQSLNTVLIFY